MNYYAGIGSRETPEEIIDLFIDVAKHLAEKGYILRSGGACGADASFEAGCCLADGQKEIYLPWNGFEGSASRLVVKDKRAFEIAEKFHPYWHNLSQGARKLQARNSHQVLGWDLNTPSKLIFRWLDNRFNLDEYFEDYDIDKKYFIEEIECALSEVL